MMRGTATGAVPRLVHQTTLQLFALHFRPKDSASKRCTRCWKAIADSHTPASGRNVLHFGSKVKVQSKQQQQHHNLEHVFIILNKTTIIQLSE